MCSKRNTTRALLYSKTGARLVRTDRCIAEIVSALSCGGYKTLACCCGHGRYPQTIVVKAPDNIGIIDLVTWAEIPRKRKFYKKDSKGYYYIPEALEFWGLKPR